MNELIKMILKCIAIDVEMMGVKYMTGYLDPFDQCHLDLIVFNFCTLMKRENVLWNEL